MTMTTSETDPAEDVVLSVPTLVESGPTAPAEMWVHAGGSMYGCPACQRVEDREG